MTKADLFLRIFEAIPATLKRFETLKNVETLWKPLEIVRILFEIGFENVGEKIIS